MTDKNGFISWFYDGSLMRFEDELFIKFPLNVKDISVFECKQF